MFNPEPIEALQTYRMLILSAYWWQICQTAYSQTMFSNSGLNVWRTETKLAFHSNKDGKISSLFTECTMFYIYNHNLTSKKKYFMGAPIAILTFYRCYSNILPPFYRLQGWTGCIRIFIMAASVRLLSEKLHET